MRPKKVKQKMKGRKSGKRLPPVKIPLSFNQAMNGLLGLSPEDAQAVRDSGKRK